MLHVGKSGSKTERASEKFYKSVMVMFYEMLVDDLDIAIKFKSKQDH